MPQNEYMLASPNKIVLAETVLDYARTHSDQKPDTPKAVVHIFGLEVDDIEGFGLATHLMREFPFHFDRTCEAVDHLIETGQVAFNEEDGTFNVL